MLISKVIHLRKVEPQDLPWLYKWENDSALWEMGDTHNPLSQKDLRDYIESSTGDIYKDGQLRLIIEDLQQQAQTLGCIDLYNFDSHNKKAAVGIYVDESARKKEIGKSAIHLLEDYAFGFLHLKMLYAFVAETNEASKKLFLSCLWKQTAILQEWTNNGNTLLFQRLNKG